MKQGWKIGNRMAWGRASYVHSFMSTQRCHSHGASLACNTDGTMKVDINKSVSSTSISEFSRESSW